MIIVTGAAGFIGYRMAQKLLSLGEGSRVSESNRDSASETKNGAKSGTSRLGVIGVDELDFFQSRPEHETLRYHLICPPEAIVESEFYEHMKSLGTPITGIIHLGACTDTTEMRVDYLTKVNLEYSQALWKRAIEFKIPFVYASSAATYGGGELGYQDDESQMSKLKPLNPYGDSKLQFDLWALSEEKAGRAPPAWSGFKFFNVYGFGERHKVKMSSVVLQGFDQISANGSLKLFKSHKAGIADGEQKRDFVYVGDVVEVLLFALQKPIKRGIFNLGSGKARSFKDLALATFKALSREAKIEFIDTPISIRDRYQYFTEANMQKLVEQEKYPKPFLALEQGVELTVKDLMKKAGLGEPGAVADNE